MSIDRKRLRNDALRLKAERASSPVGRPRTGATEVIRKQFREINRLHFEEDVRWTEVAAALADQGVIQGDGERLTGRRLTALMRNVERQIERQNKGITDRRTRGDLAVHTNKPQTAARLTLASELTHKRTIITQHEPISEDEIRQAALVRHARLLKSR